MDIDEYFKYRVDLLNLSSDEDGVISEESFISAVLPSLLESKLIDSEEVTHSYFENKGDKIKVNAYNINESGERLQLFLVDDNSLSLSASNDELMVSQKQTYNDLFSRGSKFVKKAINRHLSDQVQDSSSAGLLLSHLGTSEGLHQFDVVELFLITASATIETRGSQPQPKRFAFEDEEIEVSYSIDRKEYKKSILIIKRLVDLNFLFDILISQGKRHALVVDFERDFGGNIEVLRAAEEENFESYLCVIPAKGLASLYKRESSRLLEKNVRSFLQFRGVNRGMRETIRSAPERFIAFNNGLTITASEKSLESIDGKLYLKSLTDFQIVNGGQTTASIFFASKEGLNIDGINLMAKINIARNLSESELNGLISDISLYSNSQSRVSRVDLNSRNEQLTKFKSLSMSVLTPSNAKWFFEKSKGEFSTMMRMAGSNQKRIEREYPKDRRISKEQLGKYIVAWGEQPHLVKLGGEKVFRYFIEQISGDGEKSKPINIDRDFYEEAIAKIILFKSLEKIHGAGKNAIGQLRSAVVPYSIGVLYLMFSGKKGNPYFNLAKIWRDESLEKTLEDYMYQLMSLINDLIKKYSDSDDFGQYAKRVELWKAVRDSKELKSFIENKDSDLIKEKYGTSEIPGKSKKQEEVAFGDIIELVEIASRGKDYYSALRRKYTNLSENEDRKLTLYAARIDSYEDLERGELDFLNTILIRIRNEQPQIFDELNNEVDEGLYKSIMGIIKIYNRVVENNLDIISEFNKYKALAENKRVRFGSIFGKIGNKLKNGTAPSLLDIYHASHYFTAGENAIQENKNEKSSTQITPALLQKMLVWEQGRKLLSPAEKSYVTDYAYEIKKISPSHEPNLKRHLEKFINAGFDN